MSTFAPPRCLSAAAMLPLLTGSCASTTDDPLTTTTGSSGRTRARLEEDLAIARAQFEAAPEREDSFLWLGRRLGYLARWEEAIDVFTRGLELHPESYKLYRFRGRHRARNRQLELAVERASRQRTHGHCTIVT